MAKKFSFRFQRAAIPVLLLVIVWLELRHPFPAFRLASLTLVFVLLADLAFVASGRLRDVTITLASLAFGLVVAEAAAYAVPSHEALSITRDWAIRQPVMGWGPAREGVVHAEMRDPASKALIYSADYTIDANLLRQTHSIETGPAIVFFGDSFTFGDGVNDDETLPQAFANLLEPKQRVLNLAFTGYSPQQFLRELETSRFDSVIGPNPKLFIFLTAAWHAERTACKAYWTPYAPRYALEAGRIVYRGACNEGAGLLLRQWLENSAAYNWLIEPYRHRVNHDDVDVYVRILETAVRLAKAKYGVPTLVPYLRTPTEYLRASGFTDEAIMERLRLAGAIVVDASLQKEETAGAAINIKGDGHPTPYANCVRAELLKAAIDENLSGVLLSQLQ